MARDITRIIEEELMVAGEAGKGEGQGFIAIAGTDREWTGPFNTAQGPRTRSGSGRIDSGAMQEAFGFRIERGLDVHLSVGWVNPGEWQEYFGAQDKGFSAGGFRVSQTVEGMGVLAHLSVYMRGKVDEALYRAERRIVNGL
jgi:hypothetical protein